MSGIEVLIIFLILVSLIALIYKCYRYNKDKEGFETSGDLKKNTMKQLENGPNPNFYNDGLVCNSPLEMICVTNDSCAQYGIGETCQGSIGDMKCVCNAVNKNNTPLVAGSATSSNTLIKVNGVCSKNEQCETGYCGEAYGLFSKMCSCPPNTSYVNGKCVPFSQALISTENDNYSLAYELPEVPGVGVVNNLSSDNLSGRKSPLNPEALGICSTAGKQCGNTKDCSKAEFCEYNETTKQNECVCNSPMLLNADPRICASVGKSCSKSSDCSMAEFCDDNKCVCNLQSPMLNANLTADGQSSLCGSNGKFCKSSKDCSLGEGCNSNGMCVCQLINSTEVNANQFKYGAKCTTNNQCVGSSQCLDGECKCPGDTVYDFYSNRCECPDPEHTYDPNLGCVARLPPKVCPSNKDFICSANSDCKLGEYCDPVTRRCICNANTFSGIIKQGGKCDNNKQCESGLCSDNVKKPDGSSVNLGYKACTERPKFSLYDYASSVYPY